MKDMMFLQQKQQFLMLQRKKLEEFEQARKMLEQNKNNLQNKNFIQDNLRNNMVGHNNNNELDMQRRIEINNQLNKMKQNINNIKIDDKNNNESKSSSNNEESSADTEDTHETNDSSKKSSSKNSSKKSSSRIERKSFNSKNNQSTYSKRKYKRNIINIET